MKVFYFLLGLFFLLCTFSGCTGIGAEGKVSAEYDCNGTVFSYDINCRTHSCLDLLNSTSDVFVDEMKKNNCTTTKISVSMDGGVL